MKYKIAIPITYDELQSKIPRYETIPIWWDNECYLMYWNIWGKIYYMHPNSRGELTNKKFMFYDKKLEPQFVTEKREYYRYSWGHSIYTNYHCPNCDNDLEPYDYDYSNIFQRGKQRQHFCSECGCPILWY